MKTILLASNNPGKLRELQALLGDLGVEILTPAMIGLALDVAETGDTYAANATLKAEAFGAASGLLTLADDSGLEVDALKGAPGSTRPAMPAPGRPTPIGAPRCWTRCRGCLPRARRAFEL